MTLTEKVLAKLMQIEYDHVYSWHRIIKTYNEDNDMTLFTYKALRRQVEKRWEEYESTR